MRNYLKTGSNESKKDSLSKVNGGDMKKLTFSNRTPEKGVTQWNTIHLIMLFSLDSEFFLHSSFLPQPSNGTLVVYPQLEGKG
jgi:hypothetical protein